MDMDINYYSLLNIFRKLCPHFVLTRSNLDLGGIEQKTQNLFFIRQFLKL